jgi:glycosyltransferase involved in cell wall biosynthesis
MAALSERKGIDILMKAFELAFPKYQYPNVRLICKSSKNKFKWGIKNDPRVIINLGPVPHEDLVNNFIKKVDCFVFPTRGEGAGLPPLEMMATGMPVICTNWSGPTDYLNPEYSYPLNDFKMVPATPFSAELYKEDCGNWAEPGMDELIETMRYVYTHQDEAREKGRKAMKYVQENWTWEQGIKMFTDALGKYL